jgi:hypothetical protein
MTTTEHSTVVGIFTDHLQAEQAVNELHNLGFADDQISSVISDTPATSDAFAPVVARSKFVEYMSVGAAGGGVAGAIVGAAASLTISSFNLAIAGGIVAIILGGALVGAIAGGIVGILISQWSPRAEAGPTTEAEARSTTVTVNAPGREQEVADLLRRFGADNTTVRPDPHDATTANASSPTT